MPNLTMRFFTIIILINSTLLFGQSDYEAMKISFIDSLIKTKRTEIVIFQTGTIGQNKSVYRETINGKTKECFSYSEFLALWNQDGQFYAKRINQCYESDMILLKENENLISITTKLSNLYSLKIASDRDAIIIKEDTITYSMSCDDSDVLIDHYPYKLIQIYTKNESYISGPVDEYIFCNPKTKNKTEVLDLQKRIEFIENVIRQNNLEHLKMHRSINNWN